MYEKLDRVFCVFNGITLYPEAHVKVLHMMDFSNHHPVLLTLVDKDFEKSLNLSNLNVIGWLMICLSIC